MIKEHILVWGGIWRKSSVYYARNHPLLCSCLLAASEKKQTGPGVCVNEMHVSRQGSCNGHVITLCSLGIQVAPTYATGQANGAMSSFILVIIIIWLIFVSVF